MGRERKAIRTNRERKSVGSERKESGQPVSTSAPIQMRPLNVASVPVQSPVQMARSLNPFRRNRGPAEIGAPSADGQLAGWGGHEFPTRSAYVRDAWAGGIKRDVVDGINAGGAAGAIAGSVSGAVAGGGNPVAAAGAGLVGALPGMASGGVWGGAKGALMAPLRRYRAQKGYEKARAAQANKESEATAKDIQTNQVIQNTIAIKEIKSEVAKLSRPKDRRIVV